MKRDRSDFQCILRRASLLLLFVFMLLPVVAQQASLPPIPIEPEVRIGHLDNGLTYYIRHNEKPEKRVDFYIAQKVGSIQEEPQQRGLAHFLEHMAFNGTQNFPGNERGKGIVDWCESKAIKFGTNLNAYTSVEETVYNISNVPTDDVNVLDSCLLILHDWSSYILLEDAEIDKERGVIREEWRSRDSGMMRVYTDAQSTIYPDSKYADCMPIGNIDIVNNFPYQDLRDYYNLWYHPDLQGIIIVGDIDVDEMEAKVKQTFASIPKAQGKPERIVYTVGDNLEPIVYIGSDKELTSTSVSVNFKHEVVADSLKQSMDYLVLSYLQTMLVNMLDDRLYELVQVADPPFMGAGSAYEGFFLSAKAKDAFSVDLVCKPDGIELALQTVLTELNRMHKFGFTQSEYERARADYLQQLETAYNERNNVRTESYVNNYVRHFLDGEPIPGIENLYNIMSSIVPNIPLEGVNALAQQVISDDNQVVIIAVPEADAEKCPSKEKIISMLKGMSSIEVTPYEDKVSDEPLISQTIQPGSVISRSQGAFGTTEWTLSNGIKVILKPTEFKDDEILMNAIRSGGTSIYDPSLNLEAEYMDQLASLGGLGNFSRIELSKALAGKIASADVSFGRSSETVSGSSSVKDFETMLQLTWLKFNAPRKDQDAFDSFRTRLKTALQTAEADPLSSFSDTLNVTVFGQHPKLLLMTPDLVDQIDYDRALQMYADRMSNAEGFTFMFVGNIDPATAEPLIAQYIGSLPTGGQGRSTQTYLMNVVPGSREKIYGKEMQTPTATAVIFYSKQQSIDLRIIARNSLLNQVLDKVLTEEIREKEGGTYGASVSVSYQTRPENQLRLMITYQTQPELVARLNARIDELLWQIAQEGPSAEHLQKSKDYLLKRFADNQNENSYWLGIINEQVYDGLDLNTGYTDEINAATAADIANHCKEILEAGNRVVVVLTTPDVE